MLLFRFISENLYLDGETEENLTPDEQEHMISPELLFENCNSVLYVTQPVW